jgi:type IV pilus assembly protein PilE
MPSKSRGFTLIELMVVVAVIAILAAIALPSYRAQVRKSRRTDAIATINSIMLAEERFRTNNPNFAYWADTGFDFASAPTSTYYTFALTPNAGSPTNYTLKATGVGDQAKDKAEGTSCATIAYVFGADATVNALCTTPTAAGRISKCPEKCWGG